MRPYGHNTSEEGREIRGKTGKNEGAADAPLGSRLRARLAGLGVDDDLPELRDEITQPATFEK